MHYIWLFMLVFVLWGTTLQGQFRKTLHQAYGLDSILHIQLSLASGYKAVYWPGNQLLAETKVQLSNASQGILDHFVEQGRYAIEADTNEYTLRLFPKDTLRPSIKSKRGVAEEIIDIKLYLPEQFKPNSDSTLWAREASAMPPAIDTTDNGQQP